MRLALAKGRLEGPGWRWLAQQGVGTASRSGRGLIWTLRPAVEVALVRGRDIPGLLRQGAVDLGIVGRDVALDSGEDLWLSEGLGFGLSRLVLAVPTARGAAGVPLRVATRYPELTRRWFAARGERVEIVPMAGSVEVAPALGLADAIVDVVETGATLRANGLRLQAVLLESAAVLAARPGDEAPVLAAIGYAGARDGLERLADYAADA